MKRINYAIALLLISTVFACGSSEKKSTDGTSQAKESKTEKEAKAPKKDIEKQVVEITLVAKGEAMNEITFEPKSLSIPANSRVKLTFKNESSAAGMFHNFVLVELGSGQEIATEGMKAGKDNDFIPDDKRIFAHSKMTEMGETVSIEFDAPAKGSYHYICTYPGHYPNMIGRLNVE